MNSASQHPLKGPHHAAIKKNSSVSLTLSSSRAKSHRNKRLGAAQQNGSSRVLTARLLYFCSFFFFLLRRTKQVFKNAKRIATELSESHFLALITC